MPGGADVALRNRNWRGAQDVPVYSAGPNTASILVFSVAALNGLTM